MAAYFVQANYRAGAHPVKADLAIVGGLLLAAAMIPLYIFELGPVSRGFVWIAYAYIAQGLTPHAVGEQPKPDNMRTGLLAGLMLIAFVALCLVLLPVIRTLMPLPAHNAAALSESASRPSVPVE
jgi:hypothetical protein